MIKPIQGIKIYGDLSYREKKCPNESLEQITFVNRIRKEFPDTHGLTLFHVKNEGKLIKGQFQAITKDKAMGMVTGCPDIHEHGNPSFCMELKRRDPTLSEISDEQINYLLAAKKAGAFCCIALGCDAAWEAFNEWREINENKRKDIK